MTFTHIMLALVICIGWPVAIILRRRRVAREAAVRMEARDGCVLIGAQNGVWHRWDGKEWTTAPFGTDPHAEPYGDA